ncbi:MAG TPA: S8 family serine peptidase [Mycobacteriales bacterium]|nr:S8 family serine peptidase [Mycobacteriales bacterium]
MRKVLLTAATTVVATFGLAATVPQSAGAGGATSEFAVLYASGVSPSAAHAAIERAGGTIVRENAAVGLATVRTNRTDFASAVSRESALYGAARNAPIGYAPDDAATARATVEQEGRAPGQGPRARSGGQSGTDPLAAQQWDMDMIHAPAAHAVQAGDHRVLVGVIDTGIDGSHPDIAPNFDRADSRNFTTDVPVIDGACADDPDGSCSDPADVDEDGHGTHVAGTIASPINGLGIAGVAPNVTLVNIRAGQDSGYFFLQPTVDALTYAGDLGVDVVNMSFYIDPWLYNCPNGTSADSAEATAEQRTIIAATQRALGYAYDHGVTLVGAAGNEHTDLGHPTSDATSPDFPPDAAYPRTVDNTCLDLPTEGEHVLSITSVGPTGLKADYSNYGLEQASVAAPGGFFRDYLGTARNRQVSNEILAPYPYGVGRAGGTIDANGNPTTTGVVKDCSGGTCSYYQWIQGTSMAAPHVSGVVALIVSQFGHKDGKNKGGLTMKPAHVEEVLFGSATPHACPDPAAFSYVPYGRSWTNTCEGTTEFNGFYGHGIVDALGAVTYDRG